MLKVQNITGCIYKLQYIVTNNIKVTKLDEDVNSHTRYANHKYKMDIRMRRSFGILSK